MDTLQCITIDLPTGSKRDTLPILNLIHVESYDWSIYWDDILFKDGTNKYSNINYISDNLDNNVISGNILMKIVYEHEFYVNFLSMAAFKSNKDVVQLFTLKDFKLSKSEIFLAVSDSTELEVYIKNQSIVDDLIRHCLSSELLYKVILDQNQLGSMFSMN